jgi:hypothetical protein
MGCKRDKSGLPLSVTALQYISVGCCSENTVVHWEKSVSVAPVQNVSDRRTMYWTLLAES